jgi:protein-S-isoprenylcysteine O-methyltransferase Ste14
MSASKKPTWRRIVVYLTALAVLTLASPTPQLFIVGSLLAVLGILLRVWACGHLRKNKAVIQSGPYAHVKNPLYLGTFLILSGGMLAASNPIDYTRYFLVMVLPFVLGLFFVYYLPRKFEVEGNRLRKRFGEEYDQYARAVPSFIPRLTPHKRTVDRWNARLVLENSEVSAALWVVVAFVVVGIRMAVDLPTW